MVKVNSGKISKNDGSWDTQKRPRGGPPSPPLLFRPGFPQNSAQTQHQNQSWGLNKRTQTLISILLLRTLGALPAPKGGLRGPTLMYPTSPCPSIRTTKRHQKGTSQHSNKHDGAFAGRFTATYGSVQWPGQLLDLPRVFASMLWLRKTCPDEKTFFKQEPV